jgi:signal transduction histidine kinase
MNKVFETVSTTGANDTQFMPSLEIEIFRDELKQHYMTSLVKQAFTPIEGHSLSLGFTQDNIWLRLWLPANQVQQADVLWLTVNPCYIDEVQAYIPQPDGRVVSYRAGDQVVRDESLPRARMAVFPIHPFEGWEQTPVYLKLSSRNAMIFDISLQTISDFETAESRYYLWLAVAFGFVFFAAITSLLISFNLNDDLFLLYAVYLMAVFILLVAVYGGWNLLLAPGWTDFVLGIGQLIVALLLFMIVSDLLYLSNYYPKLYLSMRWGLITLLLFGVPLVLMGYFQPVMQIAHLMIISIFIVLAVLCLLLFRTEALAPFVLLMYFFFFIGVVMRYAMQLGLFPVNFVTQNFVFFGFLFQVVLLFMLLSRRLRYLKQNNDASDLRISIAEEENKNRRLFMNMLNHELRTPLAIIDSSVRNVLEDTKHQQDYQRLEKIRLAVDDMRHLMQVCLGSERLLSPINTQNIFGLAQMLESVLGYIGQRSDADRVIYEGLDDDVRLAGDRDLLILALGNLLDNALKYSAEDQDVELLLSRPSPTLVRICVVDKGCGFDAHIQLGQVSRGANVGHTQGLGMGLVLVQEIVEKHQGRLFIESTSNNGSVVCIELNCIWHIRQIQGRVGAIFY